MITTVSFIIIFLGKKYLAQTDILILISLQTDVVDLRYFKTINSVSSKNLCIKFKMFTPSGCKDVGIYNFNDPFYFVIYIIHPGKCLNKEFLGLRSFNPLGSKTSRLLLFYRSIIKLVT